MTRTFDKIYGTQFPPISDIRSIAIYSENDIEEVILYHGKEKLQPTSKRKNIVYYYFTSRREGIIDVSLVAEPGYITFMVEHGNQWNGRYLER